VEIVVPQPAATDLYYSCFAKIDQHNRCRQAALEIEKVFQVNEWRFRVNSSLLAMIIVDSWMMYRGAIGDGHGLSKNDYYIQLASELCSATECVTRIGGSCEEVRHLYAPD
jgi:hypothetical protein